MIIEQKKYKIAIVGFSLSGGGLEKVTANLSLFFGALKNVELHTIILTDSVFYEYGGKLVNVGLLQNESNSMGNKFKRFWFFRNYIKEQRFDFIIDLRFRIKPFMELFINKWVYNDSRIIYNVHSSKLETYLPKSKILTKIIFGSAYKVVCGAKKNKELVQQKYHLENLITIYNPLNLDDILSKSIESVDFNFCYIIGIGRFEDVKQLDKLITAYSQSILPGKGIRLVLAGDGPKRTFLENCAKTNNVIEMVHFIGFVSNPFKYLKNAKFFVLSSLYEGFGIVLAESLACGTPVVSFDCISGPNEIIKHGENGLLVENQNVEKLTAAINEMIEDKVLYERCKNNAFESVQQFSMESIGKQWLDLMKINISL